MNAISSTSIATASSMAPANSAVDKQKAEIESMAANFEAIFVRQMLSTMRDSSLGEGLFDNQGMEQFRDMQDAKIAESMAQKGVFGIAQLLTRHLENNDV
ncbi:MAG: rod-binding protein [Sphingorhabdus sp.]